MSARSNSSRGLSYMKGVSNCRIAVLVASDESYLQVGGSGMTCVLEHRAQADGPQLRAFQHPPIVPWPGRTQLWISGGNVLLNQDEFFRIAQVEEAFLAYYRGEAFPEYIQWRDVTHELA